ncbi:hypothetical protein SV7mr_36450 [Stieleria bergensis]|uniref:Uncharacterized protein n=1 Tax=Stieleria bergensis TaxID=2528025 RepID=A0A517SY86_9BACT|nr:hypothetical protein SV7mr_36450 [Planctomycetes bacterium SV_7m_r]
MNDDQETYRVVAKEQQYDVVSASDRVVMLACSPKTNPSVMKVYRPSWPKETFYD